jgi:flagellar M-ring protein FliF
MIQLITGFLLMFFWANQDNYQILFSNLSPGDGNAIVAELKKKNVPYKVEANGSIILVPEEKVYELRLSMAGDGIPSGGNVGFEIFDHTDFKTTKFVQELNYRRALQGELSRTINQFKEVKSSRVFIVIPEESLFIEDKKDASASIQLDLRVNLPPEKLSAIVHLVANAVEGLEPEHVTVVDTKGRLIFKGGTGGSSSSGLSGSQLDYKKKIENQIKENVQTMLERIVGINKAIVRVNAEVDFDKITLNEEEYDPTTTAVRSSRNIEENARVAQKESEKEQSVINQRRGVIPSPVETQNKRIKKDIATNYEINKTTRTIMKPAGTIKRLSVAAVIDGIYETETLSDGKTKRKYIPRTDKELKKFEEIVKKAMGYNEDREDQVTVSSISFSETSPMNDIHDTAPSKLDLILQIVKDYKGTIVNLLLVAMVFLFIVKPLLKSMKTITKEAVLMNEELTAVSDGYAQLPESRRLDRKSQVIEITQKNPEKAQQLIKGWIGEQD